MCKPKGVEQPQDRSLPISVFHNPHWPTKLNIQWFNLTTFQTSPTVLDHNSPVSMNNLEHPFWNNPSWELPDCRVNSLINCPIPLLAVSVPTLILSFYKRKSFLQVHADLRSLLQSLLIEFLFWVKSLFTTCFQLLMVLIFQRFQCFIYWLSMHILWWVYHGMCVLSSF